MNEWKWRKVSVTRKKEEKNTRYLEWSLRHARCRTVIFSNVSDYNSRQHSHKMASYYSMYLLQYYKNRLFRKINFGIGLKNYYNNTFDNLFIQDVHSFVNLHKSFNALTKTKRIYLIRGYININLEYASLYTPASPNSEIRNIHTNNF